MSHPPAKAPKSQRWQPGGRLGHAQVWRRGPVLVLSELVTAFSPLNGEVIDQWLVSVSRKGKRPGGKDVKKVLRDFDMPNAEEDNHHPGRARHFFLPVDPSHRVDCQCKSTETIHTEADGYTWANDNEGACRGCEYEFKFGVPCPIHGGGV